MCLIIHNPKAKTIPLDVFDSAMIINPDGFGIFYHDNGEIIHTMDYNRLEELMYDSKRPYTCHFRYATSGVVDAESCHPFDIDGRYALMMNGTIDRLVSKSKVDTEALCEILKGMTHKQMLNVLSTYKCRFSLLDTKTGDSTVVNRDLWHKRGSILYSKDNVFCSQWGSTKTKNKSSFGKSSQGFGPVVYTPETCGGIGWNNREYFSDLSEEYDAYDESWSEWCTRMGYEDLDEPTEDFLDEELHPDTDDDYDWDAEVLMPKDVENLKGESEDTTRIAVYGTLKKGKGNNHLLAGCQFLGTGTTLDPYPMVASGCPYLIDDRHRGHHVVVEVYRVDAIALRDIDQLEHHPNWYIRRVKPIVMDKDGEIIECYIYVIPREQAKEVTGITDETALIKCY